LQKLKLNLNSNLNCKRKNRKINETVTVVGQFP
jgi:ABC-type antimicrobial peptide transport system ATPase subunit